MNVEKGIYYVSHVFFWVKSNPTTYGFLVGNLIVIILLIWYFGCNIVMDMFLLKKRKRKTCCKKEPFDRKKQRGLFNSKNEDSDTEYEIKERMNKEEEVGEKIEIGENENKNIELQDLSHKTKQ